MRMHRKCRKSSGVGKKSSPASATKPRMHNPARHVVAPPMTKLLADQQTALILFVFFFLCFSCGFASGLGLALRTFFGRGFWEAMEGAKSRGGKERGEGFRLCARVSYRTARGTGQRIRRCGGGSDGENGFVASSSSAGRGSLASSSLVARDALACSCARQQHSRAMLSHFVWWLGFRFLHYARKHERFMERLSNMRVEFVWLFLYLWIYLFLIGFFIIT